MESAMAANQERMIEEIGNMSVIELADLVKALEVKFDISAVMPTAAAAPVSGTPVEVVEKTEYKVTLESAGSEKIKVIKALRVVKVGLGLTEAKQMVEEAPTVIAESVPTEEAQKMKKELEAAGATVKLA